MTAKQAYSILKKMRPKTAENQRAIEFAMTVIAQRVGEDELNKGEADD